MNIPIGGPDAHATSTIAGKTLRGYEQFTETNLLLCCCVRLGYSAYLKTLCLVDTVFYLIAFCFNLTWTLLEILSRNTSVYINSTILHIIYGSIMLGNVVILLYSIHFKLYHRKFNVLGYNTYFDIYFYLRILWGVGAVVASMLIIVYLEVNSTGQSDAASSEEFLKFKRTSNTFSSVYVIYALFVFLSSRGFNLSWYGLLAKDINFYFS